MSHRIQGNDPLGVIETDHAGISLTVHASAIDHCNMRAAQLAALLHLISANGVDTFLREDRATKDGLLWLASSLADEVQRMLPLVEVEASRQPRQSVNADNLDAPK